MTVLGRVWTGGRVGDCVGSGVDEWMGVGGGVRVTVLSQVWAGRGESV